MNTNAMDRSVVRKSVWCFGILRQKAFTLSFEYSEYLRLRRGMPYKPICFDVRTSCAGFVSFGLFVCLFPLAYHFRRGE